MMERILKERPSSVPVLNADPLAVPPRVPPRPGRVKRFILEAPHLTELQTTKFSPKAVLLLARFLAGALDRAFSRLVHQFLAEDRRVNDLSASLEDMNIRRRKNPRASN